jgi:hypothetical protein
VVWFSFPVIMVDEVLKFISRKFKAGAYTRPLIGSA